MTSLNEFEAWYTPSASTTRDLADEVFRETCAAYKATLAKDSTNKRWIEDSKPSNLTAVLASIKDAQVLYEARKGDSSTRQLLVDLSEKIHHYGGIMDVLVQHHPEYVSLVWGAMKVLFVGIVNHKNLIDRLSTGLCEIGDLPPRAEIMLQLYPTVQTKQIIIALYTNILEFLLRALRWYQESKIMHAVHAITKPVELRYADILAKISSLSRKLLETALVSSLAEQRDMHNKIREQLSRQASLQTSIGQLLAIVAEVKHSIATEQVIAASSRIEFRQNLTEIQLMQFISLLSGTALLDATKTLQASVLLRNRRRARVSSRGPRLWYDSRVDKWNRSQGSGLITISGTRKLRFHIRDFCTDSIVTLRESKIPVVWAVKPIDSLQEETAKIESQISTIEILKCLIFQAVQINSSLHTDAALAPYLNAYHAARTEKEWLALFCSVIQGIPQLYAFVDLELIHPQWAKQAEDFCWPAAVQIVLDELSRRNCRSIIKVALVSYGSPLARDTAASEHAGHVVRVGGIREPAMPKPGRAIFSTRTKARSLNRRKAQLGSG
ncbi:hypothetical protein F4802DRAFT_580431 [Xylaria palmicola]|nr:hypothetical protein F4802DRAFT_580431 [Xylaria palmicola]